MMYLALYLYVAGIVIVVLELEPSGRYWFPALFFAACWPLIPFAWLIGRDAKRELW